MNDIVEDERLGDREPPRETNARRIARNPIPTRPANTGMCAGSPAAGRVRRDTCGLLAVNAGSYLA
ncbi:MAG: hypothetical protein Q8O67_08540, partial [Deltaproteobacteria bacterium]|nr:hypothetical protein [Deltaproteobacteria bacterium]